MLVAVVAGRGRWVMTVLVRKYNPATDHDGVLAVLNAGLWEQIRTRRRTDVGRERWRQDQLASLYDQDAGALIEPTSWYVAEDGEQIVGVMRVRSETDPFAHRYREHGLLHIQQLDAHPPVTEQARPCSKPRSRRQCGVAGRPSFYKP
jgi:hypothetical protein